MVERLFWEDAYLCECEAKIVFVDGNVVRLDRTVFYAFSGGQVSDSGTIGGIVVLEARKTLDGDIEYVLEEEANFVVGDCVLVKIDWGKRYELMKLHTAQHLVAFFFEKISGLRERVGGNVRVGKASLTYVCLCGGTHVSSLKELGKISLRRKSGGKGKEDIEIGRKTQNSDLVFDLLKR
ncbi:hypothetical protein H6501_05590 [Candidatus Woesearchaeota archaeon]|nr:hypothetical protein [Nanoarchaeota archaeon]MCB9371047.1 hypothetical protein [Candidatus Woesearchaeota archaeon]USN44236.1 MAG: hypothetical protein H6500_00100 [Candidatus Woesearchaeota archaeon]